MRAENFAAGGYENFRWIMIEPVWMRERAARKLHVMSVALKLESDFIAKQYDVKRVLAQRFIARWHGDEKSYSSYFANGIVQKLIRHRLKV